MLVDLGIDIYVTAVKGLPSGTVVNWLYIDTGGIQGPQATVGGQPWDRGGYYEMALEANSCYGGL